MDAHSVLSLIFLIVALVLFLISALGVAVERFNLMALGLASLTAAFLVGKF